MIPKPWEIFRALPRSSMGCQYYQHRAQKTSQRRTEVTDNEPNIMTDQNGEIHHSSLYSLFSVHCSVFTGLTRWGSSLQPPLQETSSANPTGDIKGL